MKTKIFFIILLCLSLVFFKANPQSSKSSAPMVISVASECLDRYLNFCNSLWDLMSSQIQTCATTFQYDIDGHIECNAYATDLYINMHAVADAMYDRCSGNQN